MKGFIYKGDIYIRAIPAKALFNSTLVHEVVNRGDIFALRCVDQKLTIVPGNSEVEHIEISLLEESNKKSTLLDELMFPGVKFPSRTQS